MDRSPPHANPPPAKISKHLSTVSTATNGEQQITLDDAGSAGMRWPHARPLSNVLSLSNMPFIDMFNRTVPSSSEDTTSNFKQTQAKKKKDKPTLPILRWFNNNDTHTRSRSYPSSPSQSSSKLPMPSTSTSASTPTTPVSAAAILADALSEDPALHSAHSQNSSFSSSGSHTDSLPSRPEKARLTPSFRPPPPTYLSNLTHSTLPTSCLSPPAQLYNYTYTDPFQDPYSSPELDIFFSPTPDPTHIPHSPAPAHLPQVPSSHSSGFSPGSSLDSLRSIHERGRTVHERSRSIHNSAPAQLNFPGLPNTFWNWFSTEDTQSAGKENIRPLLSEEDKGVDAEDDRENIRHKYYGPKNPVVFCHGLLGFDTVTVGPSIAPLQVAHWRGIRDALEANGIEVLITRVPATSSPIDRAKVLEKRISEVYPGRSVHLIGHSMGGLDCRYLTTHLTSRTFKVLSITTIATPHRGSSFADHFLSTVGPARMPSVLSLLDMLPNGGGDGKAFEFLTVANMKKFNEETPDVEGVKYFSWGAVYEPGLIDTWKWSHSVIMEKEGPNDGLVSVKSARWGTYLGTLEGVNHLDLVGWINTARYKWAEIMGREIKFKPATFYLGIADNIARVVEGQGQEQDEETSTQHNQTEEDQVKSREERERAAMADSLKKGEENLS